MKFVSVAALAIGLLSACAGAPPAPPDRLVYLAIGASDAAGVGAEPLTDGYEFRIADELDRRVDKVLLTLLAIPGANTGQLDDALDLLLESGIEPGLVTLWTGANDLIRGADADDFEDQLGDLLDRLRDRTDGIIAVANLPELTELPRFREEPDEDVTRERVEAFNDAIAEQADDHDALLVDLHSHPVEDELVSDADGFHPNDEGHRRIADAFLEVILPALGLAPTT